MASSAFFLADGAEILSLTETPGFSVSSASVDASHKITYAAGGISANIVGLRFVYALD
jgi:hypothetical protein